MISTAPAKEHEVYNELLKVKEVVELYPLFGEHDPIAKIEASDFNLLGQVVVIGPNAARGNRYQDAHVHKVLNIGEKWN